MQPVLAGRTVVLGVTGSVAAYKAPFVLRGLRAAGARVRVVMTHGAERFVGRATFAGLNGEPVLADAFDPGVGGELHVELAEQADLILVVPATADLLARLTSGRADDLLTATLLSARCPVLVAPAMHPAMWDHPATRRNVATLLADGRVALVGPVDGPVASGSSGVGRMAEPEQVVAAAVHALTDRDLEGEHLVITAGPTVEDLDPVRFLSNRSSGKMGFALAARAAARGARVTLVSGPVALPTPLGVTRLDVRGARDLQAALLGALGPGLGGASAVIKCAAVGDFRPEAVSAHKLKRTEGQDLTLSLVQNPDVLAGLAAARRGARPVLVGFAVETGTDEAIERFARDKLARKGCDLLVANPAAESLGRDLNRALLVDARGATWLPELEKAVLADRILDRLRALLAGSA